MLKFPDNRNRFRGVPQWSINPGQANPDNPVKHPDPVSQVAIRDPRGAFRVSTTTDPVLLQQQAEAEVLKARADAENQKGISSPSSDTVVVLHNDALNASNASDEYQTVLSHTIGDAITVPTESDSEL